MIDGAFLKSTLEMPVTAAEELSGALSWSGMPLNRILVIASIILLLLALPGTMKVFPSLLNCMSRWRLCISLEHSLSLANPRNTLAAILTIPFCLAADYYALYKPDFFSIIPAEFSSAAMTAVFLLYLLVRRIIFKCINLRKMHGDEQSAVHHIFFTGFIICCLTLMLTIGILSAIKAPDSTVRTFLLAEISLFFLISLLQTGQILGSRYDVLTTFLYLCALEFLPASLLVLSEVFL